MHDTEESSARVLALEISKRLTLREKVTSVRQSLMFSNLHRVNSDDLIITLGQESLHTLCRLQPRAAVIGFLVGEYEYQAIQSECLWLSSAVFSGAPFKQYLPLLKQIWLDQRPITLLYSDGLAIDPEVMEKQASEFGLQFQFMRSGTGRVAVLKAVNQATENSKLLLSFIDTKLYQGGVAQDVLRLLFNKRHLMVGPSLPFVKAGALFSIYTNMDSKLSLLAQMTDRWLAEKSLASPAYPSPMRVNFNPYLIKAYGIVLPTQNYIKDNFGLCSEDSCFE
ncbi:hypothetical protein GCM10027340_20820 [Marinomonas epiphytica]